MLGDLAGGKRRVYRAQLPDERSARLLVDCAPSGAVIFRQDSNCPP
ncbi:hypothetical protein [Devosia sp. DBB001]|nr:hypothetical protein [Devosia sp. DBB001]